jgi:hypothetical protein
MRVRAFILSLLVLLVGASPPPHERARDIRLVGIQAKLYHPSTATFSRDLLADPPFALWNTVIGEGEAESPSNATLVLVELSGTAGDYGNGSSVRLRASAAGRVLVNRAARLSAFGADGRQFVAFWIYDSGCETIDLTASLSMRSATVRARIPFACGE